MFPETPNYDNWVGDNFYSLPQCPRVNNILSDKRLIPFYFGSPLNRINCEQFSGSFATRRDADDTLLKLRVRLIPYIFILREFLQMVWYHNLFYESRVSWFRLEIRSFLMINDIKRKRI